MRSTSWVLVSLAILAGLAHAQICPTYNSADALFSTTFPGVVYKSNVTITTTVWLDGSPSVVLGDIEIQNGGKLYFLPGAPITLRAHQIYIRPGGTLFFFLPFFFPLND